MSVPLVTGEATRDYSLAVELVTLFPYGADCRALDPPPLRLDRYLWVAKTILRNRRDFGQNIIERGLKWFEDSMFFR